MEQKCCTDVARFRLWQRCTYQINDVTICHDRQLDFYNVSGGVSRIIESLNSMNYGLQNQFLKSMKERITLTCQLLMVVAVLS